MRFLYGDEYGLEQVIELYKGSLIFFLMQYVKSAEVAEELTEDTFVTLAVKKPIFTENAKFKTWLFTIARNKAINFLRSAAFRKCVPLEEAETVQALDCPEQLLLRQERYRALFRHRQLAEKSTRNGLPCLF